MLRALALDLPKFTKGIYHNGKFDTRVLNRVLSKALNVDVKLNVWFDTMLAHHVLNHAAGMHGLKPLCQMYFGAEEWEADLKKYTRAGGHYELIPNYLLVDYNGADVYWTYRLWEFLAPQIEMDENNQTAFELEMQAAKMLLEMEAVGIPFHTGEANDLKRLKEADHGVSLDVLRDLTVNEKFNPNSPKQVKEELKKMGVDVPSTGVKELEELRGTVADYTWLAVFIDNLLICRKASKVIGTYVNGWAKHERDGRVRPTFLVHGTSTGRLSSTGPNAQNVPRDKAIRKIVTLYEGNSLG
jgi:DNA polymerase-1